MKEEEGGRGGEAHLRESIYTCSDCHCEGCSRIYFLKVI